MIVELLNRLIAVVFPQKTKDGIAPSFIPP
jgi:hypothetical protein